MPRSPPWRVLALTIVVAGSAAMGGAPAHGAPQGAQERPTAAPPEASAPPAGVGHLAEKLRSPDLPTRVEAAKTLGAMGPKAAEAVEPLADLLRDPYWDARMAANDALAAIGAPAVPVLVRRLQSEDYFGSVWSARSLGQMGPAAADAIGPLAAGLTDPRCDIRAAYVAALDEIGGLEAVAETIAKARSDGDGRVRRSAMFALWKCGRPGLEFLIRELQKLPVAGSEEQHLAIQSAKAAGPTAVPLLVEALKVRLHSCRRWALEILEAMGPVARPAVPAVVEIIQGDPADESRVGAITTLAAIAAPQDALDVLVVGLADPNEELAVESRNALSRMGDSALPALVVGLRHERREVRAQAIGALRRMGSAAAPAGPALRELAAGSDFALGLAAREALKVILPGETP